MKESLIKAATEKERTLGDYDVWYHPCKNCGYDTCKTGTPLKDPRCWKCGRGISRDYSDRALKIINQ